MIVTVTPSPGIDLTYLLGEPLDPAAGEVIRARASGTEASGKGVNVSRALASVGVPTVAVLPAGGATGRQLLELLDADGVAHRAVELAGPTRVNTTLLQPDGRTVKVNAPGPELTPADADALVAAAAAALAAAPPGGELWLAVCGSVPGSAPGLVGRLADAAHAAGARCAVDSSAAALAEAVGAGADLLAPNGAELTELTGASGPGDAAELARRSGGEVLLSLGADGVLWTDGSAARQAAAEPVVPVNTAGAGDALLSAWLAGPARGAGLDARLARAAAWGTATCLSRTTVASREELRAADGTTDVVRVWPVALTGTKDDRSSDHAPGTVPGRK